MKKKVLIFFVSAIFVLVFTAASYSCGFGEDLENSVIRLHVLANSDSAEDQALKLRVRDRILKDGRELFKNAKSEEEARRILSENRDFLENSARDEIFSAGFDYPVALNMGKYDFPMKVYENYAFPSGEYEAVRVEIGKAEGQNWWCVMFPPLCFVDGTVDEEKAEETLRSALTADEFDVISASGGVDLRFKVVDVFQSSFKAVKTALAK